MKETVSVKNIGVTDIIIFNKNFISDDVLSVLYINQFFFIDYLSAFLLDVFSDLLELNGKIRDVFIFVKFHNLLLSALVSDYACTRDYTKETFVIFLWSTCSTCHQANLIIKI